MKHSHGYRNQTRKVFKKHIRARGSPGLSSFMIAYKIGDKVDIIADSSFQKRGLPHRKYHGKTGLIVNQRGRCYEVTLMDGGKQKTFFIGQEHLRINKDWQAKQASAAPNE